MIPAGLLPECAAAWHRGVFSAVSSGWWHDLPAAAAMPAHVWLGLPAAAVAGIAIAASVWSAPRLVVIAAAVSAFVHPWLPAALAPLLAAATPWPGWRQWGLPVGCAVMTAALAITMTPACLAAATPMAWTDIARLSLAGLGLTGAALVTFDAVFSSHARMSQTAALLASSVAAALASTGHLEGTAAMGVILSMLWWRAGGGGRVILQWQSTQLARAGAALLVAAVPVIVVQRAVAARLDAGPSTGEAWRALDATSGPLAVIATTGRADAAAAIWRAGPGAPRRDVLFVPGSPDPDPRNFTTRALLAWPHTAAPLRKRGYIVGPMAVSGDQGSVLSRVLDAVPCRMLTPAWIDIQDVAAAQVAGIFPEIAPLRGALLYAASGTPLNPQPAGWPAEALGGFEARAFDRDMPEDASALAEALARDELDAEVLGDSRHVVRVRFDRRASAPDVLPISLGGATDGAWARRYAPDDATPAERRPSICRDTSGLAVAAFDGAPATVHLDLNSPLAAGGGWGPSDGTSRRMAATEADLLFLAGQPRPLRLAIDADPSPADWLAMDLRVTLNGVEAACLDGTPPCEWLLPAEAMRRGLNVLTLRVAASAGRGAPGPELLVHGARLLGVRVAR